MNVLTQKIKAKGYSLVEGLEAIGISLSTYRRWEHDNNANNKFLACIIDDLENRR